MQFLPRGFQLTEETRITRMICSGEQWQIYATNTDSPVLAVAPELYGRWCAVFGLPAGMFLPEQTHEACRIYVGSRESLVSSVAQGPYPGSAAQVERMALTFEMACRRFPGEDFREALYLEDHYQLLSLGATDEPWDRALAFGSWISGGAGISAESFGRLSQMMSWLPEEQLEACVRTAGFRTDMREVPVKVPVRQPEGQKEPQGRFVLLGRPALEQFFNENIVEIVLHREQYARMGISFPGAVILHGPPGCGKTFAVERLCEYLGWPRFDIDSGAVGSSYIHETSKKISQVFRDAIKAAPAVLVIDEMEAFLSDRASAGPSGKHHMEEVAEFLRQIPEATKAGVLIFAMTNMLDKIDPAILRRGRFDHILQVEMPGAEEILSLLEHKAKELPVAEDVELDRIAKDLAGRAMSDVTFVLREAGRLAIRTGKERMDMECFRKAVAMLPGKQQEKRRIGFI